MSEHAQECDAWLEPCAGGILFTVKSSGKEQLTYKEKMKNREQQTNGVANKTLLLVCLFLHLRRLPSFH